MTQTIVILGGGVGGVVAANVLSKALSRKHRVVLFDRDTNHYFRGSYPLLLVNKRCPKQITRRLESLNRKGIEFIQAEIEQVNLLQRLVITSKGSMSYDFLVIALGAEHHPETVPGMTDGSINPWNLVGADDLRNQLKGFRTGRIVLFISSLPITCPPAPYETMFLVDEYFRKRRLRAQVQLTLVTPEPYPEPLAPPKVGESIRKMLDRRGIELITQAKVLSLDIKTGNLVLDHGITVSGDLFLGIPSHWGPSVFQGSGITEQGGWIEVDPYTLETKAEKVFAIGDAAAIKLPKQRVWAPKAGIFAHYQAEVVARNIALIIDGKKPYHRYTGKGL